MNEVVAAAKGFRGRGFGYSKMKQEWTAKVGEAAHRDCVKPFAGPVFITFRWQEKTRRRDPDNFAAGKKFVLDGLVDAGVLVGDGWGHVAGWLDEWNVVKEKPGVLVILEDTEDEHG